jgi:hypothetical protein
MPRHIFKLSLALLLAVSFCTAAHADEPNSYRYSTAQTDEEPGYGAQIVLADVASIVAGVGLAQMPQSDVLPVVPFLTFSPAVHFMHGRSGRAWASFGLHAGLPVVMALTGAIADPSSDCEEDEFICGAKGLAYGFLAGMVAATVIDAAVIAGPAPNRHRRSYTLAPSFALSPHGGASFGLAGTL